MYIIIWPGHRFGAAQRNHHVGAVVLVGGLFQRRRGCGPSRVAMRSVDYVAAEFRQCR